ncbi:MAG: type II toxin-antitoxin system VapC family toxin [Acidimicrobiales bacterium]
MTAGPAVMLDTHALLWWIAGDKRLSKVAKRSIDRATRIDVSAISLWEVAMLSEKGRIELDRPIGVWANDLAVTPGVSVRPVDAPIAVAAAQLHEFHGDPADRLIVATVIDSRVALVTKDDRIRTWASSSARVNTVW